LPSFVAVKTQCVSWHKRVPHEIFVRDHLYDERSFPVRTYAHDRSDTDKRPFHKKSQTMSIRSLLPKLALILLVATVTTAIAVQTAYGCNGGGNNGGGNNGKGGKGGVAASIKASGKATIQLQGTKATLNSFSLSKGPIDTPLIIHIHAQNIENAKPEDKCKGPVLFVIKNPEGGDAIIKTIGDGSFSIKKQVFELAPPAPPAPGASPAPTPNLSKIDTWYVNVHDATKQLPIPAGSPPGTKPKFASIACGLIKVGADTTKGTAKLLAEAATKPVPGLVQTVV